MKNIYEKVMGWLRGVGIDKYWHFIAGLIIAAFFAMVVGVKFCLLPSLVAGLVKELYDGMKSGGKMDVWDFIATIIGGLIIQFFVLL